MVETKDKGIFSGINEMKPITFGDLMKHKLQPERMLMTEEHARRFFEDIEQWEEARKKDVDDSDP